LLDDQDRPVSLTHDFFRSRTDQEVSNEIRPVSANEHKVGFFRPRPADNFDEWRAAENSNLYRRAVLRRSSSILETLSRVRVLSPTAELST
jgi:uncharacterized protein (DUF58 family)